MNYILTELKLFVVDSKANSVGRLRLVEERKYELLPPRLLNWNS
jgi:hypothetical protein